MQGDLEEIRQQKARWCRDEFESGCIARRRTSGGLDLEPLYTPDDTPLDYLNDLGFPGEAPFTRGVYPGMYLGRPWYIRQLAGYGTPEESRNRYKYLLEQGQTAIRISPDMLRTREELK